MDTLTSTESRPTARRTVPLIGGLVALVVAYGICTVLVAGGHLTFPDSDDGAAHRFREVFPIIEGAGATVLGFQRVPVTVERRDFGYRAPNVGPNETIRWKAVVSPLGGLLLIGLALGIGGAVAHRRRRDRSVLATGASVAVVFAAVCFLDSFLLPLGGGGAQRGPNARGYEVTYHPSHWRALLWPLIWGIVFGSLGASIAKHGRRWRQGFVAARSSTGAIAVRAVASGLAVGIGLVLLAGLLTAIVGTTLHRSEASEVLSSPKNVAGIAEGVVIGLPHATGGGLLASMGIPARYEVSDLNGELTETAQASIFGGKRRRPFLGGGFGQGPREDRYNLPVPRYALAGLLIAAAFTLVTGYRATALSEEGTGAFRNAVLAGVFLTIVLWIVAYLFGVRMTAMLVEPNPSGAHVTLAPSLLHVLFLTPLWCIGGAIVGAVLRRARSPRAA